MIQKISLIHPSRGRAQKARNVFHNWMAKRSRNIPIEYVLSIDDDDTSKEQYTNLFNDDTTIISGPNKNLVEASNRGAQLASGDILILVSDDFDCQIHWDLTILKAVEGRSGYVLKTWDGIQKWMVTLPIMDREYYNNQGYIYHPGYKHLFADTEMTHKAAVENALIIRNDIYFKHEHPSTGACTHDEINAKADTTWKQGEEFYLERVKAKFGLGDHVDPLNLGPEFQQLVGWLKTKI